MPFGRYPLNALIRAQFQMEAAKAQGMGVIEQVTKAKELMEAKTPVQKVVVQDGKVAEITGLEPDYKTQNEGLKRAIELTGTKIDRKDINVTGSQEVVHRYELPAKAPVERTPDPKVKHD